MKEHLKTLYEDHPDGDFDDGGLAARRRLSNNAAQNAEHYYHKAYQAEKAGDEKEARRLLRKAEEHCVHAAYATVIQMFDTAEA